MYGEILAFTPKRDGWHTERDRSFGAVEFAKAASSARSSLAGTLLANSPTVVKRPALISRDCYGESWMVRLQPDNWASVRGALPQGDATREAFAECMRLDGLDPQYPRVQALDF